MASKVFHLFLGLYFFVFISSLCHAHLSQSKYGIRSLPVECLEKLIGAQKGDNVTGLHDLTTYLTSLGYFNPKNSNDKADSRYKSVFDDSLELALKRNQVFYNLNTTGVLDPETVATMSHPRCGAPDIFGQLNETLFENPNQNHSAYHYSFFPGKPRWPKSRRNLTYSFRPSTRKDALDPVAHALNKWANVTDFKFTYTEDYEKANIRLSFEHMDGPSNLLAYAYAPTSGMVNFDVNEKWSTSTTVVPGEYDLETVGLHELGHTLGLAHSSVVRSIMFPTIPAGQKKGLTSDDIDGIEALYNYNKNFM